MPIDYALLTDLYEITMAQGYRDSGHENTEACFHMYFRDTPFKGGYAIACGMAQLADMVDTYAFSGEDIDYLSKIPAPGGGALFAADFLEWLRDFKLTVPAARGGASQLRELPDAHCDQGRARVPCGAGCARGRVRPAPCPGRGRRPVGVAREYRGRLRVDFERARGQDV